MLRLPLFVCSVVLGAAGYVAAAAPSRGRAFEPGLYLGSWATGTDNAEVHWLLVAVEKATQGVTYDPPRGRALCQLKVQGDSVVFMTGEMTESSERYQLAFRGVLTDSGMTGTLIVYGARSDPLILPTRFKRLAVNETGVASDTAADGLYSGVRREESGTLNGNELLMLRTRQGVLALFTIYADVPFGPSLADSVRIHGDTVDFVTTIWGPTAPFSRRFILTRKAAGQPLEQGYLRRVASVAQLFRPEQSAPCLPPELDGRTGR